MQTSVGNAAGTKQPTNHSSQAMQDIHLCSADRPSTLPLNAPGLLTAAKCWLPSVAMVSQSVSAKASCCPS